MLFTPQAQTGFCKDKENFYARQKSGEDPDGFFLAKYEVLLKDGKMDRYERCDEREQPAFGGGSGTPTWLWNETISGTAALAMWIR